jgi:uncharacterized repeat protein (TIGR04076 family)
MDERFYKIMKRHLKYDEEEITLFKARRENRDILEKIADIKKMEIVVEIVSAKGCNTGHEIGQKFYLDGAGNLISEKLPGKCCIFLLGNLPSHVFAIHELVYAGINPADVKLRFPRIGCGDVGVENCGWGKVIVETSVITS